MVSLGVNLPSPISKTYFDFYTHLVGFQREANDICSDLSSSFNLLINSLLLTNFSAPTHSDGYVHWFRRYLTKRQSQIRVSGIR
jgi:hypothetical protein